MRRNSYIVALFVVLCGFISGPLVAQDNDHDRGALPLIAYQQGSSHKLEQVIGDCDWTLYDPQPTANPPGPVGPCKPTTSQTITRFQVMANGFGYSFEHNGKLIFLFGDTVGGMTGTSPPTSIDYHAGDPMAWSTTRNGKDGLLISFFMKPDGTPLFDQPSPQPDRLQPSGIAPGAKVLMGADDIANSGISLNGQAYLIVNTNADETLNDPHLRAFSVLVKFDETTGTFTGGRTISQSYYPLPPHDKPVGMPGHFVFTAMHEYWPGVGPWGGDRWDDSGPQEPAVLIFGNGQYRASSLYLSYVPVSEFWSGMDEQGNNATRYFTGLTDGHPTWSQNESDAKPLFYDNPTNLDTTSSDPGTVGNVSVTYSRGLDLWLMTYDGGRQLQDTTGVYFTYAREPWGPWATPQLIFNACHDHGYGKFIYYYHPSMTPAPCPALPSGSGPAGPIIGAGQNTSGPNGPFGTGAFTKAGGPFAPQLIGRFTEVEGDTLRIYYNLSTFNPYTVVKMSSEFTITDTHSH